MKAHQWFGTVVAVVITTILGIVVTSCLQAQSYETDVQKLSEIREGYVISSYSTLSRMGLSSYKEAVFSGVGMISEQSVGKKNSWTFDLWLLKTYPELDTKRRAWLSEVIWDLATKGYPAAHYRLIAKQCEYREFLAGYIGGVVTFFGYPKIDITPVRPVQAPHVATHPEDYDIILAQKP